MSQTAELVKIEEEEYNRCFDTVLNATKKEKAPA
jgi:hypothetical protein